MMNIRNLRIGVRLGLAFGGVLALTFFLAAVSVLRLQDVVRASAEMDASKRASELADVWYSSNQYNDAMTEARLRAGSVEDARALDARMKAKSAEVGKARDELAKSLKDDSKQLLARVVGLRVA